MKENLIFTQHPISSPTEIFVLTREEQERIINQSYQHPLGFLIRFLMFTGIKAEELLLLIFSDIDVESSEVDIPIVLKPENDIYRVDSSVAFRAVPIPHYTLVELSDWRIMKMCACGMNANDISHQLIATTPEGNHITYQKLQRIFCEILNSCGITYYPLSAMRDTYALRALAEGIDPHYLDAILGESNAAKIYMEYISAIEILQEENAQSQIHRG